MPADAETTLVIQSLAQEQAIWLGIAGGIIAEFLGLYKLRKIGFGDIPSYFKTYTYWIPTIIMIFLGGGVVYLYAISGIHFNYILALQVGATAPLILERLFGETPALSPGTSN